MVCHLYVRKVCGLCGCYLLANAHFIFFNQPGNSACNNLCTEDKSFQQSGVKVTKAVLAVLIIFFCIVVILLIGKTFQFFICCYFYAAVPSCDMHIHSCYLLHVHYTHIEKVVARASTKGINQDIILLGAAVWNVYKIVTTISMSLRI